MVTDEGGSCIHRSCVVVWYRLPTSVGFYSHLILTLGYVGIILHWTQTTPRIFDSVLGGSAACLLLWTLFFCTLLKPDDGFSEEFTSTYCTLCIFVCDEMLVGDLEELIILSLILKLHLIRIRVRTAGSSFVTVFLGLLDQHPVKLSLQELSVEYV